MKRNGFTLIELMIVLAIIGIVAAIVVPLFSSVASGPGGIFERKPSLDPGYDYPRSGQTVDSVKCQNGLVMKNGDVVVKDGAAVKC